MLLSLRLRDVVALTTLSIGAVASCLYTPHVAVLQTSPLAGAADRNLFFFARRTRTVPGAEPRTKVLAHNGRVQEQGFLDLVGDRAPLSMDQVAKIDGSSWTPATPWLASQDISALFPTCLSPDPENCDAWYSPETTMAVQRALWKSQNPDNCSNARYLVLNEPSHAGFGSTVHVHILMLAAAVSDGRVLVSADDIEWTFADPELCKAAGDYKRTTAQHDVRLKPTVPRYLECYFLPTTTCRLPSGWRQSAKVFTALDTDDKIVHANATSNFFFGQVDTHWSVTSNDPVLAAHRDKPIHWWFAQFTKFLLRPSDFTLQHIVWPLQENAFFRTGGVLPHPLAAIFIRAGDKHIEAQPMSVDSYFAELAPIAARLNITDVYLGSDSHDRLLEAVKKYRANYTIHYVNWQRPSTGFDEAAVKQQEAWLIRDLVRLTLADIYITAQADVAVGTLSSNQGRLADEFRRALGKARVPFLSPESSLAQAVGG